MQPKLTTIVVTFIIGLACVTSLVGSVSNPALAASTLYSPKLMQGDLLDEAHNKQVPSLVTLAGYIPDRARQITALKNAPDQPTTTMTNYIYLPICEKNYCPPYYFDDYSDPSSGWPTGDDAGAYYAYNDGEYQIITKPVGAIHGAIGDFGVSNFRLNVDVRPGSHLDGAAGLYFSGTDHGLYTFEISDGWFVVWRNDTDTWNWVPVIEWQPSSAIHPGFETNRLAVVRDGAAISVYANGQLLGSALDGTYKGSYLGVVSEAFDTANYDARFDNFGVYIGCGLSFLTTTSFDFSRLEGMAAPGY